MIQVIESIFILLYQRVRPIGSRSPDTRLS